jgi:hypothetical protein
MKINQQERLNKLDKIQSNIFNPKNKKKLTYGESLSSAMKITDQEIADEYLKDYVKYIMENMDNPNYEEAINIAKSNIGYFSGYCDNKTRDRVERLFKCSHPVFGSIKENGTPTPKEIFEMGKKIGKKK